jgi:hypothetical protein
VFIHGWLQIFTTIPKSTLFNLTHFCYYYYYYYLGGAFVQGTGSASLFQHAWGSRLSKREHVRCCILNCLIEWFNL